MKLFRFLPIWIAVLGAGLGIMMRPEQAMAQRPLGIDTSHYDASIIWTNVANAGIVFACTKATEETNYIDPTLSSNVLSAKAAGVIIGVYHFARPEVDLGLAGADAEAAFFWSVASNYITADGLSLMPMLDYETAPGSSYTAATSSQWVNEWCQDIVNFGASNGIVVTPVVYTYTSFTSAWLDTSVTNWALWMASPNGRNPLTGAPSSTGPWPTWQFWQYGQSNIPGITNGDTDVDVFNGTTAMLLSNYVVIPGAPTITAQPTNVTILQGGAANFSTAATTTPITYQWEFDGTNIAGATNSSLALTNVGLSGAGNYAVVVSNTTGSTTSSNALLTVIPMITNVVIMPRSGSAIITWTTATNLFSEAVYSTTTNFPAIAVPQPPGPPTNFPPPPMANSARPHDLEVPPYSTQHSAYFPGLLPDTTYYFELLFVNGSYVGKYIGSFSTDVSIVMQSSQAAYSGVWTVNSAAPDKYSQYYEFADTVNGSDTARAVFRPNIVTPGLYDVYFWYSEGSNRSQSAPVTVGYQGGSVENLVDETTNGGSWQLLVAGAPFAVGTNGYVRLGNGSGESNKVVIADAAKLVYSAGQDSASNGVVPSWWANFYFGTNTVDSASTDPNGYTLLADYVMGLSPVGPYPYMNFNIKAAASGYQATFWPSENGRIYGLQSATTMVNPTWTTIPDLSVYLTNGQVVIPFTNVSGSQAFYRLAVRMSP